MSLPNLLHLPTPQAVALALALGAFGCTTPAPPATPRVLARVGGQPAAQLQPAATKIKQRRFDAVSRPSVQLRRQPLEVSFAGNATSLRFALSTPGPKGRSIRYSVLGRERGGSQWKELFAQEYPHEGGPTAWHEHTIAVATETWEGNRFRFVAEALDPAERQLLIAFAGSIRAFGTTNRPAPPNVVLISLDTLAARSMGFYGNDIPTSPTLDAWFADAFTFRRAYAQYGNTLVSHSSLLSGQYPRTHGRILSATNLPDLDSLVGQFAASGYQTAAITENGYVNSGLGFDRGFDSYDDGPNKLIRNMRPGERTGAEETFGSATAWLQQNSGKAPFFLFVHTYEVHSPYVNDTEQSRQIAALVSPDDKRNLGNQSGAMINEYNLGHRGLNDRDLRRLSAHYQGRIRDLDSTVLELLSAVREHTNDDDTIVVITSDHGEQFGQYNRLGHGYSLHGASLQVPLAIRWPGQIEPTRSQEDVELIDVVPTLLDLAGLDIPTQVDGRSLAPLLVGDEDTLPPRPSFAEMLLEQPKCTDPKMDECIAHSVAVRLDGWKLIRQLDGPTPRLVHLDSDPEETRDLAETESERVAALSGLIDQYLEGAIARPNTHGAKFTDELPDDLTERLRALGYLE